nr:hypothetical protein [Tanacetum cinerariifolium]
IRGVFHNGDWHTDPNLVKHTFFDHFAARFQQPDHSRLKLVMSFPNRLSPDQMEELDKSINTYEIRVAVWDCGENKSLGPDGYTFEFFRGCNSSFIALIPKVTDTKFVTDLRPISLIGSVYKVVTKILANRLAMVISDLVSNTQSAIVAVSRAANDGVFNDLQIQGSLSLSHLFYADDAVFIESKITSVVWDKVLASKKNGGLGWVWRFLSQDGSLWSHVICAIYGPRLESHSFCINSKWGSILLESQALASKGFDFLSHCKLRVGNGVNTRFWLDTWILDMPLRVRFPRIYALDSVKEVSVAAKFGDPSLDDSFRRQVIDGSERQQWLDLVSMLDVVSLSSSSDRWYCDFNGDGVFRVKEVRSDLDDLFLPSSDVVTRWVRYVPIKINVFTWRARLDRLPTRAQIPPTVSQATNSALSMTKKQISGHQKKEELEREVSTLQKMLDHEEKVGELLKRTYERQDHAALHIPNSLPPKMKELLTELAMVENEITRLESQISHLQTDLDKEKEATKESKTKQGQFCLIPNASLAPTTPLLSPKTRGYGDKLSFETKALHFISKAIKGDYSLRDFNSHDKTKTKTVSFSEQKENYENDEDFGARSRTPRRTGILKPPSPARERHITPKRERNLGMSSESGPNQSEEDNIIKWSPNKLSENIMKCLIFIFTRLLRTSRTMEIEKSGPISRSTNFSMSFRAEPCLNSKASLLIQKESRQQDPYGIFNQEDSIPRDIGCYKNLVKFTSTSLDPKCISSSSYIPLLQKLRAYMNGLQKGFLQYGVPSSPEKLMTLMSKVPHYILFISKFVMNHEATSKVT